MKDGYNVQLKRGRHACEALLRDLDKIWRASQPSDNSWIIRDANEVDYTKAIDEGRGREVAKVFMAAAHNLCKGNNDNQH
jgi:hypothetical protein